MISSSISSRVRKWYSFPSSSKGFLSLVVTAKDCFSLIQHAQNLSLLTYHVKKTGFSLDITCKKKKFLSWHNMWKTSFSLDITCEKQVSLCLEQPISCIPGFQIQTVYITNAPNGDYRTTKITSEAEHIPVLHSSTGTVCPSHERSLVVPASATNQQDTNIHWHSIFCWKLFTSCST